KADILGRPWIEDFVTQQFKLHPLDSILILNNALMDANKYNYCRDLDCDLSKSLPGWHKFLTNAVLDAVRSYLFEDHETFVQNGSPSLSDISLSLTRSLL